MRMNYCYHTLADQAMSIRRMAADTGGGFGMDKAIRMAAVLTMRAERVIWSIRLP